MIWSQLTTSAHLLPSSIYRFVATLTICGSQIPKHPLPMVLPILPRYLWRIGRIMEDSAGIRPLDLSATGDTPTRPSSRGSSQGFVIFVVLLVRAMVLRKAKESKDMFTFSFTRVILFLLIKCIGTI